MNFRLDWDDGRKGKVAFRSRELFVCRVFRKREKLRPKTYDVNLKIKKTFPTRFLYNQD